MPSQLWVTDSLGGSLSNPKLSKSIRHQALAEYAFRQFVTIKEAMGAHRDDTVQFDKILKIDTKGGTITETATIPEHNWKVIQGSVVIAEYANAVPWSHKLETLSEFDVNDLSARALKDDWVEVLDSAAAVQFGSGLFRAVCTSTSSTVFTSNGAAVATAAAQMSDKNWRDIIDKLMTKKTPRFEDGNFRAILSINAMRGIYDYLQAIMQYTSAEFTHNNEVGWYYNCRAVRETSYLSNAVGSGSAYGEAIFFGNEAVLEAVAEAEHVVMKVPTDYGRSKGVSWQALLGYKKIWDLTADDANSVGTGIERILKMTSA